MKKFFLILLFILPLFACGNGEETRSFEQKIEYISTTQILEYRALAREEGFKYYSFIDLRANEDEYDGHPRTWSYCYGYIDVFDNACWKSSSFSSDLNKVLRNKPKSYPLLLIDYDGAYIEEAIEYFSSRGYTNIKAFQYGYFDEEKGFIAVEGTSRLDKCEDCGC